MAQTRRFFNPQDLRTKLRPGSFVYPYIGGSKYPDMIGPAWATGDTQIRKANVLYMCRKLTVCPDRNLRHFLYQTTHEQKKFKHAKVHYLDQQEFYHFCALEWEDVQVKYPNPLGLYLGEMIQLKKHGGLMDNHFYAKVLTLDGEIVWV